MQAMQRVVILFVGILSVVRATPFDLDFVDQRSHFRYTFRAFGNDALKGYPEQDDGYEIGTFESGENSNFIDDQHVGRSLTGLIQLFGDLRRCESYENPPKQGCVHVADGNVHLIGVLSAVDIEDVYKVFKEGGLPECELGEEGFKDVPAYGCFFIDEDTESVHLIGIHSDSGTDDIDDDTSDISEIKEIEECKATDDEIPEEGCVLIDEEGIHLINVLDEHNIDDFKRAYSEAGLKECIFDEGHVLTSKDPCYEFDMFFNAIHFYNFPPPSTDEDVLDVDDDNDLNIEENYKIPDEKVSALSFFQTATGNGYLQQLKLKGIFNQRSSVAKKVNAFLPKKVQSIKQLQEVQQKLGRLGYQHGRYGYNRGRVNHRPKWMKYLQTNA